MTALVAGDVTVTIERRSIEGKTRRNRCKIAFGDGALTYPAAGVPLPAFASWGMKRNLDFLTIFDENDASGFVWKYDKDNNKLRAWRILSAAAGVSGATFTVSTTGNILCNESGSNAEVAMDLAEATTALAPAAQVLYAEAVGW